MCARIRPYLGTVATFKLIRPDKDMRQPGAMSVRLFTALLVITSTAIMAMMGLPATWAGVAVLISAFGWYRWIRSMSTDWPRSQDVIGELLIEPTRLIRSDTSGAQTSHSIETITTVHLYYNYVKGMTYVYRGPLNSGVSELVLHDRGGSRHSLKFLIEQKEQLPALEAFLRTLYRSGIPVREQFGHHGSAILLKPGRSFQEIQALKKELGVDGFY